MRSEPLLALQGLRFAYPGGPWLIDGLELTLHSGQCHVLLGRSGCGKSTLLQLVSGLCVPQAGQLRWRGQALTGVQDDIALVFQRPTLLEWLSVLDNVLLPVSLKRRVRAQDRAQALA